MFELLEKNCQSGCLASHQVQPEEKKKKPESEKTRFTWNFPKQSGGLQIIEKSPEKH